MENVNKPLKPGTRRATLGATALTIAGILLVSAAGPLGAGSRNRRDYPESRFSVSSPRVVVLKGQRLLHLFDGETLVRTYPIDLGIDPVGPKICRGDGRTPLGAFRIVTRNAESRYHRFLGLDYPNDNAVARGLRQGLISPGEAASIRHALEERRCPDWGTALGGGIGIHGDRRGQDWTAGCIALADHDVEELFAVLRTGDPVEILP